MWNFDRSRRPESFGGSPAGTRSLDLTVPGFRVVTSESRSCRATAATSVTARLTAASLARDGLLNPEIFRTNWREASRTSASVAGGSKLNNGLMFRHMSFGPEYREGRMWNILLLFRTRPRCEVGKWLVAFPDLATTPPSGPLSL